MIEIINMQEETVNDVFLIEQECFSMPWSYNAFLEELQNKNAVTLVAKVDDIVVAFLNAHIILDEGYINNIAVKQNFRNNGIATELIKRLFLLANKEKISFFSLEVRKSNANAIKCYEKCGFILKGERKNFYEKPIENGLIYTKYFDI